MDVAELKKVSEDFVFSHQVLSEVAVYPNASSSKEWDLFVSECGCSYRCLYHATRFLHLNLMSVWSVRRFELFICVNSKRSKIGQCAILQGVDKKHFADQIQLLPSYEYLWREAMMAILRKSGSGIYRYGSEWMLDRPRSKHLFEMNGVSISRVRPSFLEAIDFSQWQDWEDYYQSISKNVVRNYKKFVVGTKIRAFCDYDAQALLTYAPRLVKLKNENLMKKNVINGKFVGALKTYIRYATLYRSLMFSAHVDDNNSVKGFALYALVGPNAFYLEGGSSKDVIGVGWFVLLSAIKRAFILSKGTGLFVMGPVDTETIAKEHWIGLGRSRRQCRVIQRPVETIDFHYQPL